MRPARRTPAGARRRLAAAVVSGALFLGALPAAAQEIEIARPPGARPPIEIRAPLEPAAAELAIVEIRPALRATTGAFPVEVVVKNGGSRSVRVRPAVVAVSDGIGRIAHGSAASLAPGGVANLALDLPAEGSRCGERLARTIWLQVEAETPVPGYRRGNVTGSPWSDLRDRTPADDRREVAIRIDCTLEILP